LNLSIDEGEKWIVNLIRETRMGADAKIDLEKVFMLSAFPSLLVADTSLLHGTLSRSTVPLFRSIIEKTRGLAFRTQAMGAAIARPPQAGGQQVEGKSVADVDEVR
jgi:translation initiation factor 3 subunit E